VSSPASGGFLEALVALARARVDFVVVGVGGINFYARDASQAVETRDIDVLLAPRAEVLRDALAALAAAGFSFEAGGEPFVDLDDLPVLARVIERAAVVTAVDADGARVDLMLSGAGLRFDEVFAEAVRFRVEGAEVRVGRLETLVRAKELAGRPKDVEFLRMWAARLREEAGET
jgi:predicted nucleotidyltransferase